MARHQLDLLADEACEKFPLLDLILHHRVGFVAAAEASLFLRVSAAHRGPAFEAAQWLIEQLKLRVPIWKHPLAVATDAPIESDCPRCAFTPTASDLAGEGSPDAPRLIRMNLPNRLTVGRLFPDRCLFVVALSVNFPTITRWR